MARGSRRRAITACANHTPDTTRDLLRFMSAQPVGTSHYIANKGAHCQRLAADTAGRSWWLTLLRRQPRGTIKARQCSIAVSHIGAGGKAVSLFRCGWTCRSRAMCFLAHRKMLMLQCVVTASDGTEECLCSRGGSASTDKALLEFLPALVVSKSHVADCLSSRMTDECGVVLLLKYLLLAADTFAIIHRGALLRKGRCQGQRGQPRAY